MSRLLSLGLLLALVLVALAAPVQFRRTSTEINPNAPGRTIPVLPAVNAQGRMSARSGCRAAAALTPAQQKVCATRLADSVQAKKHRATQRKLARKLVAAAEKQPKVMAHNYTGYLVYGQWDGRTYPVVEWALDITRQSPIEYPFENPELQLQLLLPTVSGPASKPTFTAYDAQSRNYWLVTDSKTAPGFEGQLFGITIAPDCNSSQYTSPRVEFNYTSAIGSINTMVGMETVYLDGKLVVLVFFVDGTVGQVDPASGATSLLATMTPASRQVNAVTARENTQDIFTLTQSSTAVEPQYAFGTFNYATGTYNEVRMKYPAYFNETQELGFEMVWAQDLGVLVVFFTGNFDHVMYINPATGNATFAVFNLAEYHGSDGHLEFEVDDRLEDLDTTANAAIDYEQQYIYFQCSDVDPETGLYTTSLCGHPTDPDFPTGPQGLWDFVNVNIEPMTYGYAGAEFVQVEPSRPAAAAAAVAAPSLRDLPRRSVPVVAKRNAQGHLVRQSACKAAGAVLTPAQRQFCDTQRRDSVAAKNARAAAMKLKKAMQPAATPAPHNMSGYMVFGQWDGETFPIVEWALDITRQATLEYPFEPDEWQLQLLLPTRQGPANKPTFTAYDSASRNYFLVTDNNGYTGYLFGVTISADTVNSTYTYPRTAFKYSASGRTMVTMAGVETVMLNGTQVVLVFLMDGTVMQVDPTTGHASAFLATPLVADGRQVNCVTYRENTQDIFLLTQASSGPADISFLVFNYATKAFVETKMIVPPSFIPEEELGFEMVWAQGMDRLIVCFTGTFDMILFVDPYHGDTAYAVFSLAYYQGSNGHLEFITDNRLEDLDTAANLVVDYEKQYIYFQCSDVDDTDIVTTALCGHEVAPDCDPKTCKQGGYTYVNVHIEPMTYGYVGGEFVQVDK